MKKRKLSTASLFGLSVALLSACGQETRNIRDDVLAVSTDAVDIDGSPVTQVWIVAQADGKCVVLDNDVNVSVNGKPAAVVSRGSAPDWIAKRYNRYAGCESPLFKLAGMPPSDGAQIEVKVTGAEMAASTRLVFHSTWQVTQCSGVKSCCSSQASSAPIDCIDAK